eukprot:c15084_g1_i1 orf=104-298(+)
MYTEEFMPCTQLTGNAHHNLPALFFLIFFLPTSEGHKGRCLSLSNISHETWAGKGHIPSGKSLA